MNPRLPAALASLSLAVLGGCLAPSEDTAQSEAASSARAPGGPEQVVDEVAPSWLVILSRPETAGGGLTEHVCVGSLVDKRTILTSARCAALAAPAPAPGFTQQVAIRRANGRPIAWDPANRFAPVASATLRDGTLASPARHDRLRAGLGRVILKQDIEGAVATAATDIHATYAYASTYGAVADGNRRGTAAPVSQWSGTFALSPRGPLGSQFGLDVANVDAFRADLLAAQRTYRGRPIASRSASEAYVANAAWREFAPPIFVYEGAPLVAPGTQIIVGVLGADHLGYVQRRLGTANLTTAQIDGYSSGADLDDGDPDHVTNANLAGDHPLRDFQAAKVAGWFDAVPPALNDATRGR